MAVKFSKIVMGLLIIATVVTGFYATMNDLASEDKYNKTIDNKYKNEFNQTKEVSSDLNQTYSNLRGISANPANLLSLPVAIFGLIKTAITLPFDLLVGITTSIVKFLGLPTWFQDLVFGASFLMVISMVIMIALRFREV